MRVQCECEIEIASINQVEIESKKIKQKDSYAHTQYFSEHSQGGGVQTINGDKTVFQYARTSSLLKA